jgi:DNA repair photolyase
MQYKNIYCSSALNKIIKKDTLFLGDYTIDPYQHCEFSCKYCDSSNKSIIYIKANSPQILEKELENNKTGLIVIGSVNDPYQNAELVTKTTRKLIKIILKKGYPCHILTKSDYILRDIDLISKFNNCYVTISILSSNNKISNIFEKNIISPLKRLEIVKKLTDYGINAGVAVIPVLPYLVEDDFEYIFKQAKKHKANYILHKYLELKGDQKYKILDFIASFKPDIIPKYLTLYKQSYKPSYEYIEKIDKIFVMLGKKYNIDTRLNSL